MNLYCPQCNVVVKTTVIESRSASDAYYIRRRRVCPKEHLFSTYEHYASENSGIRQASINKKAERLRRASLIYHARYNLNRSVHQLARDFGYTPQTIWAYLAEYRKLLQSTK